MKKIDSFKNIVPGGVLLLFFNPSEEKATKELREIRLSYPGITGVQYYQGAKVDNYLKEGDQLSLKRRPQDLYDRSAVDVYLERQQLGYVPLRQNQIIARMTDQGVSFKGRLMKVNSEIFLQRDKTK